jgi:DNA-binding transcriptional ArsR family regulator
MASAASPAETGTAPGVARPRSAAAPRAPRRTHPRSVAARTASQAAPPAPPAAGADPELDRLYALVSQYFGLFAEPMRLKIMHAVCDRELSVNEVLAEVGGTQANVSRHLSQMHRAGVLGRRKEGNSVYYRIADENAVLLCRTVCVQLAARMDEARASDGALSDATVERFMTGAA